MTPKEEAKQLFAEFYMIILEYGEEMSEECVVSILAIKCAKRHLKLIQKDIKCTEHLKIDRIIKELEKL